MAGDVTRGISVLVMARSCAKEVLGAECCPGVPAQLHAPNFRTGARERPDHQLENRGLRRYSGIALVRHIQVTKNV